MKNFYLSLCLLTLMVPTITKAQVLDYLKADTTDQHKDFPRYMVGQLKTHVGVHFPTGEKALEATVENNPYIAFEFRVGWRGYGRKRWQQHYKFPTYGFGWYQAIFIPSDNVLGNPSAVYAWFNGPFVRGKKISFNYDLGIGLSYNFIGYDPESNPNQAAIGSEFNVYFAPSLELAWQMGKRLDGSAGIVFTHFSNGRSRTPNKGVNLLALDLGLTYNFNSFYKNGRTTDGTNRPKSFITHVKPDFYSRWEFYYFLNAGWVTSKDIQDRNTTYLVASTGFDVARHYSFLGKYGIGVDLFYDASIEEEYLLDSTLTDMSSSTGDYIYFGIHASHELMLNRFSIITQLGWVLVDAKGRTDWYARVGGRYDITKNLFGRVTLKTPNGFAADFIEWGLGYYWYKTKHKY